MCPDVETKVNVENGGTRSLPSLQKGKGRRLMETGLPAGCEEAAGRLRNKWPVCLCFCVTCMPDEDSFLYIDLFNQKIYGNKFTKRSFGNAFFQRGNLANHHPGHYRFRCGNGYDCSGHARRNAASRSTRKSACNGKQAS